MATITMDTSEYEALKDNKKLLEEALKREISSREEIKKLQDEKIEALNNARMKVVKEVYSEVREYVCEPPIASDELMLSGKNFEFQKDLLEMYGIASEGIRLRCPNRSRLSAFINKHFKITRSKSKPKVTQTTHGLDCIKDELRAELKAEISSEIEAKVKIGEEAEKIISDQNEVLNHRSACIETLNRQITKLMGESGGKDNKIADLEDELSSVNKLIKGVKYVLKDGYSILNKKSLLDRIISKLNEDN